jgi:glucose dehydrogenase
MAARWGLKCQYLHRSPALLAATLCMPLLCDSVQAAPLSDAGNGDDGNWTMPGRDYSATRFSPLHEISTQTVKNLQVAFTFSVGTVRGQESAPIVVGHTLYIVSSFPNILYALDLEKPGAPVKWRFEPKPDASAQGEACCEGVNRGPTVSDGRVWHRSKCGAVINS